MVKDPINRIFIFGILGVLTKSQNMGEGSFMLKQIIQDHKNSKICLESTNKKNFTLYENHGFVKQENVCISSFNFTIDGLNPNEM